MNINVIRFPLVFLIIISFQLISFSQNQTKDATLSVSTFIIDDDQEGGSDGDADGLPEGGETIEMPLSIINSGTTTAHNVNAVISCDDPNINITDNSEGFGAIDADEIKWSSNDFDFKVLIGCPEKDVEFTIIISSDEGSWSDSFIVHILEGDMPDLSYHSQLIDDDDEGSTSGNGNGIPENGETIGLRINIQNLGQEIANNVSGIITCSDPDIVITDNTESFGDIEIGGQAWCNYNYDFNISSDCPTKEVEFMLDISSDEGVWYSSFVISIENQGNPNLEYLSHIIDDDNEGASSGNGDGLPVAGESIQMPVQIINTGEIGAHDISAILSCNDPDITITDSIESYEDLESGEIVWNNHDYNFDISETCPAKDVEFMLKISSEEGVWYNSFVISIVDLGDPNLEYLSHIIDDDNEGASSGNGDSIPMAGESIQMPIQIINTGEIEAHNISAILSCDDPDINITDNNEYYDDLEPGESVWANHDYNFDVSGTCTDKEVEFILSFTSDEGDWEQSFVIPVMELRMPDLNFNNFIVDDDEEGQSSGDGDGNADPGEKIELNLLINNIGNGIASNVRGTISTDDIDIVILDNFEDFGDIEAGEEAWSANDYDFKIADECLEKDVVFNLDLISDEGSWSTTFTIHISAFSIYEIESYASPDIGGQTQGDGEYADNETATMTAIPAWNYLFVHWMEEDVIVSEDAEYSFQVNSDRVLIAVFKFTDGINDPSIFQPKLYPNPCTNLVSLELESKAMVYIINANGLLVKQIDDFKNKHIIDMSKEANGIYFIKIISDDQITVLKLLKE